MSESSNRQNQGYLFPNKKAHDRQPDFRGRVNVNGEEFLLSGWIRPKDGEEMISISVTDPSTLPPRPGQGGKEGRSAPASQGSQPSQGSGGSSGAVGDIFGDLPG